MKTLKLCSILLFCDCFRYSDGSQSQSLTNNNKKLLLLLHPFIGLFSRTTWISRHQKGKPFRILLEQEKMG